MVDECKKKEVIARWQQLEADRARKKSGRRWAETREQHVLRLGRVMRSQSDLEARYPWLLAAVGE